MLLLHWVLVGAAVLVAIAAFERSRRLSQRLKRLTESYWNLRYELGQLQARVNRLEPQPVDDSPARERTDSVAFIPLSSLKR